MRKELFDRVFDEWKMGVRGKNIMNSIKSGRSDIKKTICLGLRTT